MPGSATTAKVLLKCRPTEAQLADRLASPVPSGLELYLDAQDIADPAELDPLAGRLLELAPSPSFHYIVEGPVVSLDGQFFDISRDNEANRECLRRICYLSEAIAAEAVLIHAITPVSLEVPLTPELYKQKMEDSHSLLEFYAATALDLGIVPMLENIPPVARQRQAAYYTTPVGMSASDLVYFATRFPGLMATVDLSHAQLFLNALRMQPSEVQPELAPLLSYLSTLDDAPDMESYLREVEPYLYEVHVSNARGLLEEGLPYGDGDLNLDALTERLAGTARYLITETIEPEADRAVHMREAQKRMESILSTCSEEV